MRPVDALTDASALDRLVRDLEPDAKRIESLATHPMLQSAYELPSRDDPGRSLLHLVALPASEQYGASAKNWFGDFQQEGSWKGFKTKGISVALVIFPGEWPSQPNRAKSGSGMGVRLVSAVDYLWIDRLGRHDDSGQLDGEARARFLTQLSARWSDEDQRAYTDPALSPAREGDQGARDALDLLLAPSPDIEPGRVSVLYGPGGIGKTFFLRHLSNRMTRIAVRERIVGIPVFAELPLLLHADALENYLQHAGLRLPLHQIRTLLDHGVIVPILDAMDELVRGQAREGTRQFLRQLGRTASTSGRILLSSRDYYLNLDPLIREELGSERISELTVGYFDVRGRRRYIQMRTALDEQGAARWAQQLESQASETLAGAQTEDVESLIGHPLFLEAFCSLIEQIPGGQRVNEAETFRLTSPDVFGDIVNRVLEREHGKVAAGWQEKGGTRLAPPWDDPFKPETQRQFITALVQLTAKDGAAEVIKREASDRRYRELRHGVFTFTAGVDAGDTESTQEAMRNLVRTVLGEPEVPEDENVEDREALRLQYIDEVVSFYRQHTLADTRADLPQPLVFATRHRAYFDYLLAEALIYQLSTALSSATDDAKTEFVFWCLDHHIVEKEAHSEGPPFASCLDFALWHKDRVDTALREIEQYFRGPIDPDLGSYVLSLALAVALRAGARTGGVHITGQGFTGQRSVTLELLEQVVPAISGATVSRCEFPRLILDGVTLRDCTVGSCEIDGLELRNSTWKDVDVQATAVNSLSFRGVVQISDSTLLFDDLEEADLATDPSGQLTLRRCRLTPRLFEWLSEVAQSLPNAVRLIECEPVEEDEQEERGAGRLFLDRIMSMARKHGHPNYGVYSSKLRGKTRATGKTFTDAIQRLQSFGAIEMHDEMVVLTDEGEDYMYAPTGKYGRTYDQVAGYWDPVVRDLNEILA